MYIILHALCLLVVVQCVTVMNISALHVRRPKENTALNAETEQFTNAKISGSVNVSRIAVEQRRFMTGMADTQR